MKHIVIIKSKNQNGFVKIETKIEVNEDQVEELALKMFDDSIQRDEGKSIWAELESTTHSSY